MEDLESLIVRALQQMARLVMFIELKSTEIPPLLNQHLQYVKIFTPINIFFHFAAFILITPFLSIKVCSSRFLPDASFLFLCMHSAFCLGERMES